MRYDRLSRYRHIFQRKDFDYLSDSGTIDSVHGALTLLNISDGLGQSHAGVLKDYLSALIGFTAWLGGAGIPRVKLGYEIVLASLSQPLKVFQKVDRERELISSSYAAKFAKSFIKGLDSISSGLQEAFLPEHVMATGITAKHLCLFILDTTVGLGTRFAFNSQGKDSFVGKLPSLNKQELAVAMRLLLRPGNQVRTVNGWRDYGLGATDIRILAMPRALRSPAIMYLFRRNEHPLYQRYLGMRPA